MLGELSLGESSCNRGDLTSGECIIQRCLFQYKLSGSRLLLMLKHFQTPAFFFGYLRHGEDVLYH